MKEALAMKETRSKLCQNDLGHVILAEIGRIRTKLNRTPKTDGVSMHL